MYAQEHTSHHELSIHNNFPVSSAPAALHHLLSLHVLMMWPTISFGCILISPYPAPRTGMGSQVMVINPIKPLRVSEVRDLIKSTPSYRPSHESLRKLVMASKFRSYMGAVQRFPIGLITQGYFARLLDSFSQQVGSQRWSWKPT